MPASFKDLRNKAPKTSTSKKVLMVFGLLSLLVTVLSNIQDMQIPSGMDVSEWTHAANISEWMHSILKTMHFSREPVKIFVNDTTFLKDELVKKSEYDRLKMELDNLKKEKERIDSEKKTAEKEKQDAEKEKKTLNEKLIQSLEDRALSWSFIRGTVFVGGLGGVAYGISAMTGGLKHAKNAFQVVKTLNEFTSPEARQLLWDMAVTKNQ